MENYSQADDLNITPERKREIDAILKESQKNMKMEK